MAKHCCRLDATEPFEFTGFGVEEDDGDAAWGVAWEDSGGVGIRICIEPAAIGQMLVELFGGFDAQPDPPTADMRAIMNALAKTMAECLANYSQH